MSDKLSIFDDDTDEDGMSYSQAKAYLEEDCWEFSESDIDNNAVPIVNEQYNYAAQQKEDINNFLLINKESRESKKQELDSVMTINKDNLESKKQNLNSIMTINRDIRESKKQDLDSAIMVNKDIRDSKKQDLEHFSNK